MLMLAFSAAPAVAEESQCFDIYPNSKSGPEGAILLNRCTGQTWLLVGVNSGYGSKTGWFPIPIDMTSEPEGESKKEPEPGQAD